MSSPLKRLMSANAGFGVLFLHAVTIVNIKIQAKRIDNFSDLIFNGLIRNKYKKGFKKGAKF